MEDLEENIRETIELFYGSVPSAISECIRGFFVPAKGKDFICCDFASIESRVLAWLAGDEKKLNLFRTNQGVYEYNAARIYRIPIEKVTPTQRQVGKVAELSLGYGGGKGAFQRMAKGYGVKVSDDDAETIKKAWRDAHPEIVKFWYDLEKAAMFAVRNKGQVSTIKTRYTSISFRVSGSFLWCRLPSSRVLCYPYPKIEDVKEPFEHVAITYMGEDSFSKKWEKLSTYGGKLAENVTQAASRCLLTAAMLRLEKANYPITLHVHDEIVCELPLGYGSVNEMSKIMCMSPDWAKGLPIAAEGWRGNRYRKG